MMLPRQPDCPDQVNRGEAKSSLEGKLDCMSLSGYGSVAKDNVDLNRYQMHSCQHLARWPAELPAVTHMPCSVVVQSQAP